MPNFDEATQATEEMFANEQQVSLDDAMQTEEQAEPMAEPPVEEPTEQPTEDNTRLNEAAQTAEIAAQLAKEKDMQLQQVMREVEVLKAQNQQMKGTIDELSSKNEEALIEEAMQPPTLDINGLAFADEETIRQAQAEYAQKMLEYNRQEIMKEISPFVEQAKEGIYLKEKERTISDLANLKELSDIKDMMPQLDKIIANNKWLQSEDMPMDEKYILSYAIARGVNAINTPPEEPKELTSEELMALYDKNPSFQELIEKKRIDAIKNSQQVPPFSASSGAVNAALNIKEKPKTFEEASERTRRMFGLE